MGAFCSSMNYILNVHDPVVIYLPLGWNLVGIATHLTCIAFFYDSAGNLDCFIYGSVAVGLVLISYIAAFFSRIEKEEIKEWDLTDSGRNSRTQSFVNSLNTP